MQGNIIKTGMGKSPGYWSTTKGFLNSDKYIQDSYFYQDFSYQIKAASNLDSYKGILYNTFHPTGTELFGEYYLENYVYSIPEVLYEQNYAQVSGIISQVDFSLVQNVNITGAIL